MFRKTLLKRMQRKVLDLMAKVKSDIQDIQLWVDDSPNSRVYRIRYAKVKDRWHELVEKHKVLSKIEYIPWQLLEKNKGDVLDISFFVVTMVELKRAINRLLYTLRG